MARLDARPDVEVKLPVIENESPWCCPTCHGVLRSGPDAFQCDACRIDFPIVAGIADFRVALPTWVEVEADRTRAREIEAASVQSTPAELVSLVFQRRRGWSDAEIARRTNQILEGPARLARELDGWLQPATSTGGPFLDLGCGAGQLLAGAATVGRHGIGIDVMLEWLVVAKHLIAAHGGRAALAAAMAEALPIRTGWVGGVVSLDVIEHVGDQGTYIREIERVLAPGATCALSTPNRYSLAPEPHVGVWGVGWLPRRYQAAYVLRRSGKPYAYCRLLSGGEIRRLLARSTSLQTTILTPPVPDEEMARFGRRKKQIARLYNRIVQTVPGQLVMSRVGAFFRVLAVKPK
jgi:2-polyprenyl-3-methyl-5-hydroxy-6-metoxy-1,4-benzoquinol methylase